MSRDTGTGREKKNKKTRDRIEGSGAASLVSQHLAEIKQLFGAGWAGHDPRGAPRRRRMALFQSRVFKDIKLGDVKSSSEDEQRNTNKTSRSKSGAGSDVGSETPYRSRCWSVNQISISELAQAQTNPPRHMQIHRNLLTGFLYIILH